MRKTFLAVAFALACGPVASGCSSALVHGVVRDKPTGNPIASATITVGEDTVTSDGLGSYSLDCKVKSASLILVNASGYFLYSASVNKRPDEGSELVRDFELVPRGKQ